MHKRKSKRHVMAAAARWRAAESRAQAERDAGIPDRAPDRDQRQPITLDLCSYGGGMLTIEPRIGYISVRVMQDGAVVHCAAMKQALHWIADQLPRTMGARNTC